MVDVMKFPGKTPAYYYARAAIALKRGEKEAAQKYLENVKKYYSDEQCAYFAQSLKEIDLTSRHPLSPPSCGTSLQESPINLVRAPVKKRASSAFRAVAPEFSNLWKIQ